MASVEAADVSRMTSSLYLQGWGTRSWSKFWTLLVLASVIATTGILADSTATVIGAMIVAPLMTPILGIALSVVLGDRRHLLLSAGYVIAGACVVVAIGFTVALTKNPSDAFASNSQVASRISPRLIDLLGALATGLVGAFALVRSDISDALPGVAIAISLVPPLAVVGVLIRVGRYSDAEHALLLFGTNVAAIVATGTVLLLVYRVRDAASTAGMTVGRIRRSTLVVVGALVVAVAVPLALGTASLAADQSLARRAQPVAEAWAHEAGWQVASVEASGGTIILTALGPPPNLDVAKLRTELNAAGCADADLRIRLVVGGTRYCPAHGDTCTTVASLGTG